MTNEYLKNYILFLKRKEERTWQKLEVLKRDKQEQIAQKEQERLT